MNPFDVVGRGAGPLKQAPCGLVAVEDPAAGVGENDEVGDLLYGGDEPASLLVASLLLDDLTEDEDRSDDPLPLDDGEELYATGKGEPSFRQKTSPSQR